MSLDSPNPFLIGLVATAVASGIAGYVVHEESRPATLDIYVYSLKGSRAIFIRTPDDRRILIGGGPNSEIVSHITDVLPFYTRHIDAVIAPAPEGRDVTGLIDVLDRYDVGRVYVPRHTPVSVGISSTTDRIYELFLDKVHNSSVEMSKIRAGDQIRLTGVGADDALGTSSPVVLHVLFPEGPDNFHSARS